MGHPCVETVLGPVPADRLGIILPHEHFPSTSRAGGCEETAPPPGYAQRLDDMQREVIREAQARGVGAFVELTPPGNRRCVPMMQRLSRETGLHVVACTGFYLENTWPEWVAQRTEAELTQFMVRELTEEMPGTGAKAGIIKLAGGNPRESEPYRRVFRAAAAASRETGAAISTHSGGQSRAHFEFLVEAGAAPERLYMGHADFEPLENLLAIARAGGHVILTCWGVEAFYTLYSKDVADRAAGMVHAGFARSVLMSIDFALIIKPEMHGIVVSDCNIPYRTPASLFRYGVPPLRERGVSDEALDLILRENPRDMLARAPAPGAATPAPAPALEVRSGLERRAFCAETRAAFVDLVNGHLAGWPYSKPIDDALVDHWAPLPRFQPPHVWVAYRDGRPTAALHGEILEKLAATHMLAMRPGAAADGIWLLGEFEKAARAAGRPMMYGPYWGTTEFYAGYVMAAEPCVPSWDRDGVDAFIGAGYRPLINGVWMTRDLDAVAEIRPAPEGYEIVPVPHHEFGARGFGYHALFAGAKAAHCMARYYPTLQAPRGGTVGQIGNVTTLEPHRGKGLAGIMVAMCLRDLRAMGAAEALIATSLDNPPALRCYERAGFKRRHHVAMWAKELAPA